VDDIRAAAVSLGDRICREDGVGVAVERILATR
jgi:hypothetical protein